MKIKQSGWELNHHYLDNDLMQSLVQLKDDFLNLTCSEVKETYKIEFSTFEPSKFEQIELAKAITRCFLRYDEKSIFLAQSISKNIAKHHPKNKYCTIPYPIIHFPNDTSEIGAMHRDGYPYIKHFITSWTPLNDCLSQPLAIVENSHRVDFTLTDRLKARLNIKNSLPKPVIKPDLKIGEFLKWYGATEHEGLLNRTDKTTIALVVRFTNVPMRYERTATIDELQQFNGSKMPFNALSLTKKFISIYKEIDLLTEQFNKNPISISQLYEQTIAVSSNWNLEIHEKKKLAFMLTLLAQRLENKKETLLLYLFSITGFQDSMLGLNKVISTSLKKFGMEETEKFIKNFLEKNTSQQALFIKNLAMPRNRMKKLLTFKFNQNLPFLKWLPLNE